MPALFALFIAAHCHTLSAAQRHTLLELPQHLPTSSSLGFGDCLPQCCSVQFPCLPPTFTAVFAAEHDRSVLHCRPDWCRKGLEPRAANAHAACPRSRSPRTTRRAPEAEWPRACPNGWGRFSPPRRPCLGTALRRSAGGGMHALPARPEHACGHRGALQRLSRHLQVTTECNPRTIDAVRAFDHVSRQAMLEGLRCRLLASLTVAGAAPSGPTTLAPSTRSCKPRAGSKATPQACVSCSCPTRRASRCFTLLRPHCSQAKGCLRFIPGRYLHRLPPERVATFMAPSPMLF